MKKLAILSIIAVILASCATTPTAPPPKPEAVISAPLEAITGAIIADMTGQGNQLLRADDYLLVFGRRDESPMAMFVYGSHYDRVPELRTTFALAPVGDGVLVRGSAAMITNPGSAYERATGFTGARSRQMLDILLGVKTRCEAVAQK